MKGGRRRFMDFRAVNGIARQRLPELLRRWLPGGRFEGPEYVVRNPRRSDSRPGSFKINVASGRWADFATGDKGGDPISLLAFLRGIRQVEAAHELARSIERDGGGNG